MTRPIKFRAWDAENKSWVEATLKDDGWSFKCLKEQYGRIKELGVSIGSNWQQFTGLLDKNGSKEVYEGDIIDENGEVIGNVYESPSVYKEGTHHIIAPMGTDAWRGSESIAMGFGCHYAK